MQFPFGFLFRLRKGGISFYILLLRRGKGRSLLPRTDIRSILRFCRKKGSTVVQYKEILKYLRRYRGQERSETKGRFCLTGVLRLYAWVDTQRLFLQQSRENILWAVFTLGDFGAGLWTNRLAQKCSDFVQISFAAKP